LSSRAARGQPPFLLELRTPKQKFERQDTRITFHGVADDETGPVMSALLRWLIKRDAISLAELKAAIVRIDPKKG
jgi:hypothetical protein